MAQIGDAVLDHRDALDAHPEGVAVALRVVADVPEDARVDDARAEDLDPAALLADRAALAVADVAGEVHLHRGLGEREEVRAEADLDLRSHHLARKVRERRLEVGERHGLHVDVEPLDLVEVRGVRRVRRVAAVAAAGVDDADGRLAREHRADLDGRGLRAQQQLRAEPERVALVARGVVLGGICAYLFLLRF